MNRFCKRRSGSGVLLRIGTSVVIMGCAIFALLQGVSSVSENAQNSQAESLKNAILRSAVHCYATEGAYPESLAYLQEHYGISWNTNQYVVDYDIVGSNLMPTVMVIPLKK